jgi:hypothetical protein
VVPVGVSKIRITSEQLQDVCYDAERRQEDIRVAMRIAAIDAVQVLFNLDKDMIVMLKDVLDHFVVSPKQIPVDPFLFGLVCIARISASLSHLHQPPILHFQNPGTVPSHRPSHPRIWLT